MNFLTVAQSYLAAGLCVLPAALKEKRPALTGWKDFQTRKPTPAEIKTWFTEDRSAVCLVAGYVSGNLELLDFDCKGEAAKAWSDLVKSENPTLLEKLVLEQSQSGGYHAMYRLEDVPEGNTKLAKRVMVATGKDDEEYKGKHYKTTLINGRWEFYPEIIETRGEGGIFLCAPSPGYKILRGAFESIPVITDAEHEILIRCARSFNEKVTVEQPKIDTNGQGDRPGDDFAKRGDLRPILQRHGWSLAIDGDNQKWRRPGKRDGISATFNGNVFYVFSSNADPFENDKGYSKFHAYTLLEHKGDFKAAAKALAGQGYGDQVPAQRKPVKLLKVAKEQSLLDRFAEEGDGKHQTPSLYWKKLSDHTQLLYPGTLAILGGPPGHGKSLFGLQACVHLHSHGVTWSYLPLEKSKQYFERRMLAHVTGDWAMMDTDKENAQRRKDVYAQNAGAMKELMANVSENPRGMVEDEEGNGILESLPYTTVLQWTYRAAKKSRVIVIDPLAQIDFSGPKPWKEEEEFVRGLQGAATQSGATIILVMHTIKRQGMLKKLELSGGDLSGSAAYQRLSDTVLLLDVHDKKESDVCRPMDFTEAVTHEYTVIIDKARNGRGRGCLIAFTMDGPAFFELGVISKKPNRIQAQPYAAQE